MDPICSRQNGDGDNDDGEDDDDEPEINSAGTLCILRVPVDEIPPSKETTPAASASPTTTEFVPEAMYVCYGVAWESVAGGLECGMGFFYPALL